MLFYHRRSFDYCSPILTVQVFVRKRIEIYEKKKCADSSKMLNYRSTPWDQSQPRGWIYSAAFCTTAGTAYYCIYTVLSSFFVGINLHFKAFSSHFHRLIEATHRLSSKQNLDINYSRVCMLSSAIDFQNEISRYGHSTVNENTWFVMITISLSFNFLDFSSMFLPYSTTSSEFNFIVRLPRCLFACSNLMWYAIWKQYF